MPKIASNKFLFIFKIFMFFYSICIPLVADAIVSAHIYKHFRVFFRNFAKKPKLINDCAQYNIHMLSYAKPVLILSILVALAIS